VPRLITVQVQCDWAACPTIGTEGDGTVVPKTVAIDGKQAREFLLCKTHLEDFEEIVMPLMQVGVKVEQATVAPRRQRSTSPAVEGPTVARNFFDKIDCLVENCDRKGNHGLSNRTGLAQHAIRTHGFENLAVYEEKYGRVN
jgi:hypothetical protein